MSVAETDIALQTISWDDCNRVLPVPAPPSDVDGWGTALEAAAKDARKQIWSSGDNSAKSVEDACYAAVKKQQSARGDECRGLTNHAGGLARVLKTEDITVMQLPTLAGVDFIVARLDAWWPVYWEEQDKSDIDRAFSQTDAVVEYRYWTHPQRGDALLARLVWLNRLRDKYPGRPVTLNEYARLRHRRRVLEAGEKHAAGLSNDTRAVFFDRLDDFAQQKLEVPIDGDSVREAIFSRELGTVGLSREERCRVAASLLQTAAALNGEQCLHVNSAAHPIHGYAMVFGDAETGEFSTLVGAAPGCWRLQIEGDQYVLTCDLWPRPVVMSHHEYGRARGSANAILRDVGVSVDSPPGHWKKIWETYGLRSQLLLAAQRVDPCIRLEQVFRWIHRLASEAPAAHRPPTDGSAVRLSDGATVADVRWLVERALADGMIMPHEREGLEREIRRRSMETNRRDAAKRQRKLLVLDPGPVASENPLISTGFSASSKNEEDR